MRPRFPQLLAILLVLAAAADLRARVEMSVTFGWEKLYRPGRWTPVFVTAASDKPRQATLRIHASTDQNFAMRVGQSIALGPTPGTYPLLIPLDYDTESGMATLTNADDDGYLAGALLQNNPATPVSYGSMFVGISGNESTMRLLRGQLKQHNVEVGSLPQMYLPRVAIGYDALDLLVLDQPNFNRLDADQQRAIVQWVQTGGRLLLIPGSDPLPASGPLIDALPVRLGATCTYDLPTNSLGWIGLPARFATLKGRAISAVAKHASSRRLVGEAELSAYRAWVGFGQIMVIPADVSMLQFNHSDKSRAFWTGALDRMIDFPQGETSGSNTRSYYGADDDNPRRGQAIAGAMEWLSDVPGAGRFGFSYLALALLVMMIVVGPVDWFLLKWLGRQPWTWITTTGWIGVVTLAAIYTGHIFKSGELHFRTITLVDEANQSRVAQATLAGIYSPRTTEYPLEFDPQSWWKPISVGRSYGPRGLQRPVHCHQDYRGNTLLPMTINVWNLRFIIGVEAAEGGGAIEAKLSRTGSRIDGSITNRSPHALSDLAIRTADGVIKFAGRIEPGATAPVSAAVNPDDRTFADSDRNAVDYNTPQTQPATAPSVPIWGDLNAARSDRIRQMLGERADLVCIYAQFDAAPEMVKLPQAEMRQSHRGLVRAVVPLQ